MHECFNKTGLVQNQILVLRIMIMMTSLSGSTFSKVYTIFGICDVGAGMDQSKWPTHTPAKVILLHMHRKDTIN